MRDEGNDEGQESWRSDPLLEGSKLSPLSPGRQDAGHVESYHDL